jgi:hypothetical protein
MSAPGPLGPPVAREPRKPRLHWWVFVAILGVAGSLALTAVLLWPTNGSCNTCQGCTPANGAPTPLGSVFAMGTPVPEGGASNHSYAITVTPASGLRWVQATFLVTDSRGATLSPVADWNVSVRNYSATGGNPFATYDFTTSEWSGDAASVATSGQTLVLELGTTNLTGQGDHFEFLGPIGDCSSSGTVSQTLP